MSIYHWIVDVLGLVKYCMLHVVKQLRSAMLGPLPLEKKIVFTNFEGRGYGCNPKYIAEELIRRNSEYDLVWLVKAKDKSIPERIRQVSFDGRESYRELATAKVIINNVKGEINLRKRKGQYYIQTWHAGFSPKYLERDAKKKLPRSYILESKNNSRDTDLFLSNSVAQTEEYRRAFWCTCPILEKGLPRNDVFFGKLDDRKRALKNKLGIDLKTRIVMFAPTFRGMNDELSMYDLDLHELKKAVISRFGSKWVIALRMHPNVSCNIAKVDDMIDWSDYSDMQDLLLVSDIVITDYSSSIFDAIEMDKIVFIYANDLSDYQKSRGLKREFYNLPFKIAENRHQLIDNIMNLDVEQYLSSLVGIKQRYCTFDNGEASDAVVDIIEEKMGEV